VSSERSRIDLWMELGARRLARGTSRRSVISLLGRAVVGVAALPLLPIARAAAQGEDSGDTNDPASCDYWRHCAIDGFLCACCGGTASSCPPGTEMSPVTWIGTCRNPEDGKDYIISYNDCCGKSFCGRCICNRNEGDKPVYVQPRSNDINWCVGATTTAYHCSTAIVLGVGSES
jgi:methylamine dehydrogenase light chain